MSRSRLLALALLALVASPAAAQDDAKEKARFHAYGRIQADAGYDFGRIDSLYGDRLRVSKLPVDSPDFGRNGRTYFSVRQTRLGLEARIPSDIGEIFTLVEFDLIGSGSEAGQTNFRLRHAYSEWAWFGAGQYWSAFVDTASHAPIFESYGPTGLPWVRNVQLRWMPLKGATRLTFALEKPGAAGDDGDYQQLIQMDSVQIRLAAPEWVAAVGHYWKWGHARLSGVLRRVWWDDLPGDSLDLAGDATGWGFNLTGAYKFGGARHAKDALRLQYLIGEGVQNYLKDATADVAPRINPADSLRPFGEALPVRSFTAYAEVYRGKWGWVAGYSMQDIDNSDGQEPDAFHGASYATATAAYYPAANIVAGLEYQYGRIRNFSDGWRFSDHRLQLTVRYSLSADFRPQ